jgi:cellobiose-specific phosphotransferase system component IIC
MLTFVIAAIFNLALGVLGFVLSEHQIKKSENASQTIQDTWKSILLEIKKSIFAKGSLTQSFSHGKALASKQREKDYSVFIYLAICLFVGTLLFFVTILLRKRK